MKTERRGLVSLKILCEEKKKKEGGEKAVKAAFLGSADASCASEENRGRGKAGGGVSMGLKLPGRESHDRQQADQPGPWVGSVPVKGPAEVGRERGYPH